MTPRRGSGPDAGAQVPQGEPAAGAPGLFSPEGGLEAFHLARGDVHLDGPTLERDAALRERSGSVSSPDPIACLLYVLARDHVPQALLESVVDELDAAPGAVHHYSNGYLARWALDAAARVRVAETPDVGARAAAACAPPHHDAAGDGGSAPRSAPEIAPATTSRPRKNP